MVAFVLERDRFIPSEGKKEGATLGRMYADGEFLCFTCEDEDRKLEDNPKGKVYGRTAIPRGKYKLRNSLSPRLHKIYPEILGVPTHTGVRIHGGNRAEDSLGCILVGKLRTADGVAQCADMVARIIQLISNSEESTLEVK